MDWGTVVGKIADGATRGFEQATKNGPTKVLKGMRDVAKQTTKDAKKYEPKKSLFPFFK